MKDDPRFTWSLDDFIDNVSHSQTKIYKDRSPLDMADHGSFYEIYDALLNLGSRIVVGVRATKARVFPDKTHFCYTPHRNWSRPNLSDLVFRPYHVLTTYQYLGQTWMQREDAVVDGPKFGYFASRKLFRLMKKLYWQRNSNTIS